MVLAPCIEVSFIELSCATLSGLGIHNVLVGLTIAGILGGLPQVLLVPIVASAACALANGLSYYVMFGDHPAVNRAVVSVFMDSSWLVQEAGLPFYGYLILVCVLDGRERRIFLTLFWSLLFITVAVRIPIIVLNARFYANVDGTAGQHPGVINRLHIGYFVSIAMAECLCAVFLLRRLRSALRSSMSSPLSRGRLFSYLMSSTEIRVAMLGLIGVFRAITFSFHTIKYDRGHHTGGVSGQIDFFVYMVVSFFPIIMFVDILASRLVFADECSARVNNLGVTSVEKTTTFDSPRNLASESSIQTSIGQARRHQDTSEMPEVSLD